ncbi:MAG: hypothetical protein ACR2NW_09285 [Thermodesulfobacteriota bacterium]
MELTQLKKEFDRLSSLKENNELTKEGDILVEEIDFVLKNLG